MFVIVPVFRLNSLYHFIYFFQFSDNQKFCLCEALLSVGDWDHAQQLINKHPQYACISRKRIATKLIKFIEYLIDPLYQA